MGRSAVCVCCDRAIALQRARGAGATRGQRGQRVLGACAAQRAFDALRAWCAAAARGMRESRATRVRAREAHSDARLRGACGWAPRAFKDARLPTRSRGPHLLGAARVARARAHCLTRVAPPQRAGSGSRGPVPGAVCAACHRAPRCVRVIYARRRGAWALAARPHASSARASPPTTTARAPLHRSAVQWCMGARTMRVCVRAVTHRHQQQRSACGIGLRTTASSCTRPYRYHVMCVRGRDNVG